MANGAMWTVRARSGFHAQFADARPFCCHLAAVAAGPKRQWGYIDQQGGWKIKPTFAFAGEFSAGLAPAGIFVGRSIKVGYINTSGAFVIAPRFAMAHRFVGGLARVVSPAPHRFGVITPTGQMILPCHFNAVWIYPDGVIGALRSGRMMYFNREGKQIWTNQS